MIPTPGPENLAVLFGDTQPSRRICGRSNLRTGAPVFGEARTLGSSARFPGVPTLGSSARFPRVPTLGLTLGSSARFPGVPTLGSSARYPGVPTLGLTLGSSARFRAWEPQVPAHAVSTRVMSSWTFGDQ